jgi:toxin ParE1/3/4
MKVIFADAALRDIEDITVWLKANYPGIGKTVERRMRLVVAHIARWPGSMRSSAKRPGVRVAPLGRYPY